MASPSSHKSKSVSVEITSFPYTAVELDNDDDDDYDVNDDKEFVKHIAITKHRDNPIPPFNPQHTANQTPIITTNLHNKQSICSCTFYRNRYNILRFITLIINLFFIFVCILYGYGQITTLKLDDYFCRQKTLQEINIHSIENNLNEGTDDGCWTTSNNKVDENKLYNAGSSIAYKSVFSFTVINIVKCVLFMIIALALFIVFIIFVVQMINDCRRFCNKTWYLT